MGVIANRNSTYRPNNGRPRQAVSQNGHAQARWLRELGDQNGDRSILLLPEIAEVIGEHILMNHDPRWRDECPVMLLINGPPGTGKSVAVTETAERMGVGVARLNASALEDKNAGEPVRRIKKSYWDASQQSMADEQPYVLVVDDLDRGLGLGSGNVTGTTNTLMAVAALMELADRPSEVGGHPTAQIPIVVTMNNPGIVDEALCRARRCRRLDWNPRGKQLLPLVRHLLRGLMPEGHTESLVAQHSNWTTADFAQLRYHLVRRAFRRSYADVGLDQLQSMMNRRDRGDWQHMLQESDLRAALADAEAEKGAREGSAPNAHPSDGRADA